MINEILKSMNWLNLKKTGGLVLFFLQHGSSCAGAARIRKTNACNQRGKTTRCHDRYTRKAGSAGTSEPYL